MLRSFRSSPRGSRKDEQMGSVGNSVSRVHWDASAPVKTSQPWWLCAWLGVDGLEHDLGHLFMTGLGFREPCKQHWVVLQGHTSHCIKYGGVSHPSWWQTSMNTSGSGCFSCCRPCHPCRKHGQCQHHTPVHWATHYEAGDRLGSILTYEASS